MFYINLSWLLVIACRVFPWDSPSLSVFTADSLAPKDSLFEMSE